MFSPCLYFTTAELGISHASARIVANAGYLGCVLDILRMEHGPIRVTSGYRDRVKNQAVGGSSTSAHLYGLAADIASAKASQHELWSKIVQLAPVLPIDQAIRYHPDAGGHIHIAVAGAARGQVLYCELVKGEKVYTTEAPGWALPPEPVPSKAKGRGKGKA